jgi:hypothetical protein
MTAPPMKLVANQRTSVRREKAKSSGQQKMFFFP